MTENNRRSTDPLIVEMHGMLQRLDQKMDDTQQWFKVQHESHLNEDKEKHRVFDERLKPLEEFHGTVKSFKWPLIGIATPTLAGIGALLWDKIKAVFHHAG